MSGLRKLPIKVSAGLGLSLIDRAVKEAFAARCMASDLARLPARENKVAAYRERFAYNAQAFEARLTLDKRARYQRFTAEIDTLRRHLETEGLLRPSTKRVQP